MIDLEKVIKAFDDAKELVWLEDDEYTVGYNNGIEACKNIILSLLKDREAKPMTEYDDGWDCPRCGLKLIGKTASGYPCNELDLPNDEIVKYCPVCGQEVKWNDLGIL